MATIPDFSEVCPFDNAPYRTHTFRNVAIAPPQDDENKQPVPDIARTMYECGTVVRIIADENDQPKEAREQSDQCDRNEKPFLRAEIERLKAETKVAAKP